MRARAPPRSAAGSARRRSAAERCGARAWRAFAARSRVATAPRRARACVRRPVSRTSPPRAPAHRPHRPEPSLGAGNPERLRAISKVAPDPPTMVGTAYAVSDEPRRGSYRSTALIRPTEPIGKRSSIAPVANETASQRTYERYGALDQPRPVRRSPFVHTGGQEQLRIVDILASPVAVSVDTTYLLEQQDGKLFEGNLGERTGNRSVNGSSSSQMVFLVKVG